MSFIRQQCDEEVWNEVAKNMRPRPTIRKLVDIMSVIKCGNQVDGDKISARRDAVFEDYQDDVLSGKLWKNPPIRCENGEAKIDIIEGSKVHKQRPFYLHGTKADALRKIIERNLYEFGWLEGCMSSEWCSAPFPVPKPPPADQSSIDAWRLVVDYRALNAATVPDAHPLPLIEKEIATRAKGKLFTVLDLRHGFHRMPLRKEDRHLTAMCTPCGTVQWTVLPMGLKNAPSMFQKMMETILFQKHKSLDLQEFCSIYIDDLLIATPLGNNFDECLKLHDEQVRKVLEVLRQEKLFETWRFPAQKHHHKLLTMRGSSKDSRGNRTRTKKSCHCEFPWVQSTAKRGTNSLERVTNGNQILLGYQQERKQFEKRDETKKKDRAKCSGSTREARVWTQEGQDVPPECGILWLCLGRWDKKTSPRKNVCPAALGKA